MGVSTSERFWQGIIDEYYAKYEGIAKWHKRLIQEAMRTGQIQTPSRSYPITPDYTKREPWPHTIIKNYPVQGFGADLVMLARLQAAMELRRAQLKGVLISTIHDSIVADCPADKVEAMGRLLDDAVNAVPRLCKATFGYAFSLPLTSEVQYGPNKKDMLDLKIER